MEAITNPKKLIRPANCLHCKEPLFYLEDPKHEPEIRILADFNLNSKGEYYCHLRCWNTLIGEKET